MIQQACELAESESRLQNSSVIAESHDHRLGTKFRRKAISAMVLHKLDQENAFTGHPVLPPLKQLLQRALGVSINEAVELSNDPRFLTAIIPAANICATADEVSRFYQCLLRSGEYQGKLVFAPKTVRHATAEQSYWELDLTLGFPVRCSLGFMLGNRRIGLLGGDNPHAFGHLGLSNIFTWADPERGISVTLLTTGKPIFSPHVVPLFRLLNKINETFNREFAEPPSKAFATAGY